MNQLRGRVPVSKYFWAFSQDRGGLRQEAEGIPDSDGCGGAMGHRFESKTRGLVCPPQIGEWRGPFGCWR